MKPCFNCLSLGLILSKKILFTFFNEELLYKHYRTHLHIKWTLNDFMQNAALMLLYNVDGSFVKTKWSSYSFYNNRVSSFRRTWTETINEIFVLSFFREPLEIYLHLSLCIYLPLIVIFYHFSLTHESTKLSSCYTTPYFFVKNEASFSFEKRLQHFTGKMELPDHEYFKFMCDCTLEIQCRFRA